MQKRILFLLICGAFGLLPLGQVVLADTDSPERRRAAAERYFKAVAFDQTLVDMVDATINEYRKIMPAVNVPDRDKLIALTRATGIETHARELLIQHFTAQEIEALVAFYESPIGQSILKKFPRYSAELQAILVARVISATKKLK